MLGYVKAAKAEMKVRDYEIYRGIYCSLCNALGKNYSVFARLLLSYDFAFAAILKLALGEKSCTFTRKRCPLNPTKKCFFCEQKDEINLCSHAIVIIAYYKILDNIHDKEIGKRILSLLLYPVIALMHKKAKRIAPHIESIVSESMEKQAEAESNNASVDEAADASAQALGKIFSYGYYGEEEQLVYKVGYLTGRLVYILDAVDDLESDIKSGNFNPLKKEFPSLKSQKERNEFADRADKIINLTHASLLEAKDELDIKRFGEITENVLFSGIDFSRKKIIDKYRNIDINQKSFTIE